MLMRLSFVVLNLINCNTAVELLFYRILLITHILMLVFYILSV